MRCRNYVHLHLEDEVRLMSGDFCQTYRQLPRFQQRVVPKYQQNGSAVSSLVSQVVTAILQVWIAIRIFNISFNAKYVTKIISFVLCITLMSYLVYNVELMWGYRIVITLTVIIILAFVFKVFSIKDITTFVTTGLKDKK